MLCRMLVAQGKRISVIIRGYLGKNEHGCALVSDGERVLLSAAEAGDEAFLLAKTLPGVPVAAGRDRIRTGRLVFEKFQPDIVVMDDGMQHWRLHRDLDILLLNACRPFDNGWTVPRGMLREPKSHIRRAGIVLLTNARLAGDSQVEAVREEVADLAPGIPVFYGDLSPLALLNLQGQVAAEPYWLSGRRVAAVSALGNPASFEATLEECGAVLVARFQFPDHHAISREELDRTMEEARLAGAEAILTTEKDAVKMPAIGMPLPLLVLQVAMSVQNEAEFVSAVSRTFREPAAAADKNFSLIAMRQLP